MTAEEIRKIIREELAAFFNGRQHVDGAGTQPLSIAQQAINMAREGKIEESKAILKAYSKSQRSPRVKQG